MVKQMINLEFMNAFGRKQVYEDWLLHVDFPPTRLYYAHSGICHFMHKGAKVTLEPGYLYLIPYTLPFYPHSDKNHPFDHSFCDFETVPPIMSNDIFKLNPNMSPMVKSACDIFLLITEKADPYLYQADLDEELFSMFKATVTFLVKQFIDLHNIHVSNDRLAISILNELLDNIDREITINDLANKYYMSQDSIIRKFKKSFGTTPYAYLKELRLRTAAQLIRSGENLTDAALATNYTSASSLLHAMNSKSKHPKS